ncbi:unnamed protein product, partial [Didymodactylos carnosus]
MTINEFKRIYGNVNPMAQPFNWDAEAERIFMMFDTDRNGVLTFEEFVMAYVLLQRGVDPVTRWQYVMNAMPLSRPGFLSQQEAQILLGHMQNFYQLPIDVNTYYNMLWNSLHQGGGYISQPHFIQALQQMPGIQPLIW